MKKPRLVIILIVMTLLLTSCQWESGSDYDLTIMGKKSDLEKSYMTRVFDRYEKETGKKIKLVTFEDAEYETKAAKSFEDGDAPDIFMHFNNADLSRFNVAEDFYYLNEENWVCELTDSARAYYEDKSGNLLGLPFWESSISGCYYNKTILDSLGLKAATTQSEFDLLCQVLVDTGYTPICWPANGCSWMIQFGLDPLFADDPNLLDKLNKNEVQYLDIPEVKNMVQWVKDASDKGWFGSDYIDTGWDQISPMLSSGDAVMTFIWDTWFYTDFHADKYSSDDFALMPVFLNTVSNGTYEGGNLNMMMVNKNSNHVETALDFLGFCAMPANYNAAFEGISTVNCFKGQTTNIQSKMVTEAAESIAQNERVSTAATRIIGYSADDVASAFNSLLHGKTDVSGCVQLMDEYRIERVSRLNKL